MTGRPARSRSARSGTAEEIRAAGAVLYRDAGPGVEVAVIHRPRHDDWTFPKGKADPGEHLLLTAVREVIEETGIRPVLGRPLATVRYEVDGRPKRVEYWESRNWAATPGGFTPNSEVDRLDWLAPPQAGPRLSYWHDHRLLDCLVKAAQVTTVPYILLRHASAGRKNAWRGDDLLRPLDPRGTAEAAALTGLLSCFAPQRVISSAAERCLATVMPYAARIGAEIEAEPSFTLPAGPGGEQAARRRTSELLRAAVPTVICGHRENLSVLLSQALADLGAAGRELDWSPPKGGFWVLHVTAGGGSAQRLAALEHHELNAACG